MSRYYTRGGNAEPGASMAYHTGGWRSERPVHHHAPAPCHHACPAGEDAQAYLAALEEGDPRRAWELLVAANPLPAITGRVCPHPCESSCNRGQFDSPIAIHDTERWLGDQALTEGWDYPLSATPAGEAVAIVGAGPAGLSCAWHLLRRGHPVQIFEAEAEAGGLCASAIPPYRLPKNVVAEEVERILDIPGITFNPRQRLGRDFSLAEMEQQYPAVFLGIGAQQSRAWSVDGTTPTDLHQGLELLKEWLGVEQIPTADSVAVVGGGNTAVDLCRVFRHAGVQKVYLVTHSGLPGPDVPDAMRALPREVEEAQAEGVEVMSHRGIRRLVLRGERVVGLELVTMKKMPDASGVLNRIAFEGTETVLPVDMVVPAIGQQVVPEGLESLVNLSGLITTDSSGLSSREKVWVGGDASAGTGTVAEAIGEGARAAASIAAKLAGQSVDVPRQEDPTTFAELNLAYFAPGQRAQAELLSVELRDARSEVDPGLSAGQVRDEAARCLSCGNCLACDNCYTLCPDSAVLKTRDIATDGSHYVFDLDYCKGCGLCANECPSAFIRMQPED